MTVETSIGKITASKKTLNAIALMFAEESENARRANYQILADVYRADMRCIHDALDSVGYYDDLKE